MLTIFSEEDLSELNHDNVDAVSIAHFGRIQLTADDVAPIQKKFSSILDAFDVVADVEVGDVAEFQAPKTRADLREDILGVSLGQEKALDNAPFQFEGHFRVPPVL